VEKVVRPMNSVSPKDADSSFVSGVGSKNLTRFLDLLGVAGGVGMVWPLDFGAWGLIGERRFGPTLPLLFLLAATKRPATIIV
jgi:hypothetical protein